MCRASIIILILFALHAKVVGQSLTVFRSPMGVLETAKKVEDRMFSKPVRKLETVQHFNLYTRDGAPVDSVVVVAFEDPTLYAELLACEPTAALDLPQKIIIWSENEDVYLGFMDPYFMKRRFLITDCQEVIDKMTRLVLTIVNETIKDD